MFSLFVSASLFVLSLCGFCGCYCYEQIRAKVSVSVRIMFSPLASADIGCLGRTSSFFLLADFSAWVPPAGWAAGSNSLLFPARFLHAASSFPKVNRQCPLLSSTSLRRGQVGSLPWASGFTGRHSDSPPPPPPTCSYIPPQGTGSLWNQGILPTQHLPFLPPQVAHSLNIWHLGISCLNDACLLIRHNWVPVLGPSS